MRASLNRKNAFGAGALLFAAVACCNCSSSSSSSPNGDAGGGGGGDAGQDAPASDGGGDAGGKLAAPTELRALESNSETMSDACKIADYGKAQGIYGEATTNWAALKPKAQAAGASAALMAKIDGQITKVGADISGKLQRQCETDANAITLTVPDLFDLFTFAVPSDALRGDGVFRQLQIDGEYSDWTAAAADLAPTEAVWARLRPLCAAQAPKRPDVPKTDTVVADMDKAVQKCKDAVAAKDATALQAEAQNGLDYIDTIETMFK